MRFFPFVSLMLLIFPGGGAAQEAGGGGPYLIPQTVFVGDRGRLVVPLGPAFARVEAFVQEAPERLPGGNELVIHRIELERRGGAGRLLIDFAAYAPGRISLPPIELPPGGDGRISGLEISIASILNPSSMILAEPAAPLPVPGTGLLIYGSLGIAVLVLFLGIGGGLGGRRCLLRLWDRFRRRLLIRFMEKTLRRLKIEALRGRPGGGAEGETLARFSGEMRNFFSLFTGTDCRAWTAGEFSALSPELSALFCHSDTLRFSGGGIDRGELFAILEDARLFLRLLGEAEKARRGEAPVRGGAGEEGA